MVAIIRYSFFSFFILFFICHFLRGNDHKFIDYGGGSVVLPINVSYDQQGFFSVGFIG